MAAMQFTADQMPRFFKSSAPLLATLAAALLGACDAKPKNADQDAPRPALVSTIHFAPQSQNREFTAVIRPRIESDLGFRVSGKVVKRFVEVGQRVKSGDILATLDDADLKLQKEQAEAEYAAASVVQMQAAADEGRAIKLKQQGWTAQAAVDRARASAQEARGRNQRSSRAVELARNSLEYATLRADATGVVTQVSVEPGQVVAAGAPAIRIARDGEMEAAVALPETYATVFFSSQADAGSREENTTKQGIQSAAGAGEARLFLWSNPKRTYRAKLRELSPSADPATRNFAARFSILDPDPAISLGMSATLTISSQDAAPLISVPLPALFSQGQGAALWRVDSQEKVALTPVSVQRYEAGRAIVSGPLEEGARIVVLGVQKLEPGQRIRPIVQD
jgi:RND family efflux transporter MFP subunit